jgi:hypothetical protein
VHSDDVVALVAGLLIVFGAAVFIMTIWQRGRLRELAHRERLAMIERGLAPPPEVDPVRFERALGQPTWDAAVAARAARYRRSGVITMGLGAALFLMIGFTAEAPGAAFGIGGAIVILGLALYVNSHLEMRYVPPPPPREMAPPSPSRTDL